MNECVCSVNSFLLPSQCQMPAGSNLREKRFMLVQSKKGLTKCIVVEHLVAALHVSVEAESTTKSITGEKTLTLKGLFSLAHLH